VSADLRFIALPTELVQHIRAGGADANGMPAERTVSSGPRNPCRHCLQEVPEGAGMLVLAHRPFPRAQPYAELGPIFLCADECARWDGQGLPSVLEHRERHLIKGYGADDRIVYGTGRVVDVGDLAAAAAQILQDERVRYVHVRSATNNCFTCRIDAA
jgi:hypothetical protein